MKLLEFIFQSLWHFIGSAILINGVLVAVCYAVDSIASIFKKRQNDN